MAGRRTSSLAVVAALLLFARGALARDAQAPPITKLEVRHWPDQTVKRRVLGQLNDILIPMPHRGRRPPKRPLTDVWFWTAPRSTGLRGICSSSVVTVYFRTDRGAPQTALAPVHASDLSADRRFFMLIPPRSSGGDYLDRADLPDADQACAALDPAKDTFFNATDQDAAVQALWLSGRLRAVAQSQVLQIDCQLYPSRDPAECRKRLSELKPSNVANVERCEAPEAPPMTCTDIDLDDGLDLRIVTNAAGEPVKVRMSQEVIVADERID